MIHYRYNKEILFNKNILIHHHLGMGDHISLCGMVNYISEIQESNKLIYVLAKEQYYKNVKPLYAHNERIIVHNIGKENEYIAAEKLTYEKGLEYLKIGHDHYNSSYEVLNNWNCNQVFYHLANIPYENRFTKFTVTYDKEKAKNVLRELNPEGKPFIFLHDDPSRGFNINYNKNTYHVIKNDIRYSLYDFIEILNKAEEIHLMPSSFYCLVESLPNITSKLYYYNIRGARYGCGQKYNWNIIE